jgi:uncharacterized protein YerC
MVQISKKLLDKELEEEIYNQLWYSLGKVNNSKKTSEFFSDFLTKTEKLMLAKRFATAILIKRGRTANDIRHSIHVSFSTVGSVSSWIKNARPETQSLLETISNEKGWGEIIDKIENILDALPFRRHSDWKEESEKRRERRSKRYARKSLR